MDQPPPGVTIALARIAEEAAHPLGKLDLSDLGLNEIPQEVGRLTELRELLLQRRPLQEKNHFENFGLNTISDLSPLSGLTGLQRLMCWNTQVTDLSPLSGLASLHHLDCSETQVADLTPLSGLASLQHLDCSMTRVADLSPLSGLVSLQLFSFTKTQVTDLAPLSGLANLQILNCSATEITDLAPLLRMSSLRSLYCLGTQVADLSPLSSLSRLLILDCTGTKVNDLSPLSGMSSLKRFWCAGAPVTDLSPLSSLSSLEHLDCKMTKVADLSPLAVLVNLLTLDCSMTKVADLSSLSGLANLQGLDCSGTQVADLSPLSGLTNLQHLRLSATQVTDLAPLSGLSNLKSLACFATQITDLSPLSLLAKFKTLSNLFLMHNKLLRSVPNSLGALRSLEPKGLELRENPLEDPTLQALAAKGPEGTTALLAYLRGEPARQSQENDATDPPPEIPPPVPGLHLEVDANGTIVFAPPAALDQHGNNLRRLRSLHPELIDAAKDLVAALSSGNRPHHDLLTSATQYLTMLDQPLDALDFTRLYARGLRLANAETAALQAIANNDRPPLSPATSEALRSLLDLHGPFIFATRDGLALRDGEENWNLTIEELRALRAAADRLLALWRNHPDLISPAVTEAVSEAVTEIGQGKNLARGGVIGLGAVQNVVITMASVAVAAAPAAIGTALGGPFVGAMVGSPGLVAYEGIKKSKPFLSSSQLVTNLVDRVPKADIPRLLQTLSQHRDLLLRSTLTLEELAKLGQAFAWTTRTLAWLRRHRQDPPSR